MKRILLLLSVIALFVFSSCSDENKPSEPTSSNKVDDYNADIVNSWIELSLELTKNTQGFSPPVAARAWGYQGVAIYQATYLGMEGSYNSLKDKIQGFEGTDDIEENSEYHWPIVVNACLSKMFQELYKNTPESLKNKIINLENSNYDLYSDNISENIFKTSKDFGIKIAEQVYEYSKTDGQDKSYLNNFPDSYTPPTGEGLWVPTPPNYQPALQPYWGQVRTFSPSNSGTSVDPGPPPPYSTEESSLFYKEAEEVYTTCVNITPEQLKIAEFWADNPGLTATPPGHSMSILKQILEKENSDLQIAIISYLKLGMGLHDSFVSCWASKYKYNYIRPVTVIRDLWKSDFLPDVITPPFPEYTSGHSVQSGASAEILTELFGDNYHFIDKTHVNNVNIDGTPRTFNSFMEAAEEAAISRLYGGIHYKSAIDIGIDQGIEIGQNILTIKLK